MRRRWSIVVVAALLASCTGGGQPSTTEPATASSQPPTTVGSTTTPALFPAVDLSARPTIWFAPHPAVDLPGFVKGSADYFELFASGPDWSRPVHVFKIYDQIGLAPDPTDDELLEVIGGLRDRGVPLAVEL